MGGALKGIGNAIGGLFKGALGGIVQMALSYFTGGLGSVFGQLLSSVGGGAAQAIGGMAKNFMNQGSDFVSNTGLNFMGSAFNAARSSSDVANTVGSFTDALRSGNTSGEEITNMAGRNLAEASAKALSQTIFGNSAPQPQMDWA